jgi:hypothetical protein
MQRRKFIIKSTFIGLALTSSSILASDASANTQNKESSKTKMSTTDAVAPTLQLHYPLICQTGRFGSPQIIPRHNRLTDLDASGFST